MTSVHLLGPWEEIQVTKAKARILLCDPGHIPPLTRPPPLLPHNPVTLQGQQLWAAPKAMYLLIRSCLVTVHCVKIGRMKFTHRTYRCVCSKSVYARIYHPALTVVAFVVDGRIKGELWASNFSFNLVLPPPTRARLLPPSSSLPMSCFLHK